jgi:hypothetical protein
MIEHGRVALEAAADRRSDSYSSFVDTNRCDQEADFLLGDVRVRGQSWQANLYASANWALASHYFNVGIAMSFLSTPVTYFLVDYHDVSSAVLNSYRAVTYLPWCGKLFLGMLSDTVPIFESHRKSYLVFGWCIFVLSNILLC